MKRRSMWPALLALVLVLSIFGSAYAAPPSQATSGETYTVQADDWLSKLAERYYGDPLAYPTIVQATNARAQDDTSFTLIQNPDLIEIGQKLWIPEAANAEAMTEAATVNTDTTTADNDTTADSDTTMTDTSDTTAADGETDLPTRYELPGENIFPEGIAYNDASGKFYVGSTNNGALYEGDLTSGEVTVFSEGGADGRTAATGMKVDDAGQLWVSGAATGQMFVYDTADGSLVASYTTPDAEATFINDVTITPAGTAYFTDSNRPILFRIANTDGGEAESWLDFTGTPIQYIEGFNLNGIASSDDGRYLIVVHSADGTLFRIDTESQEVTQIDTGEADLTAGDGILLDGQTLYVIRNQFSEIVPVTLSADFSTGTVGEAFTDSSLIFPTTMAKADDSLLVVNSQFNNRGGTPEMPFTVSRVPLP